jgi:hypothetical protein
MIACVPGGGMMMDAEGAARMGAIVVEHAMQQPELIVLRAENMSLRAELAAARAECERMRANTCSSATQEE